LTAEQLDLSVTQDSPGKKISKVAPGQIQAPRSEFPLLITPGNALTTTEQAINNIDQKPYGLASPGQRANHYSSTIRAAAQLYRLDPALVKAVIHAESAFNPFAVSIAGAQGLMQIMPATAEELALADPFHPGNNVLSGSKLLRRLLDKYQQDETLALAAYNAGEQAVKKYRGVPPFAETQNYIEKVRRLRLEYQLEASEQIAANTN
jgi:soluble lytic murein transglycosylase-like protein